LRRLRLRAQGRQSDEPPADDAQAEDHRPHAHPVGRRMFWTDRGRGTGPLEATDRPVPGRAVGVGHSEFAGEEEEI